MFHINKKGEVNKCKAKTADSCPLSSLHFETEGEALAENEKQLSMEYGLFSKPKLTLSKDILKLLSNLDRVGRPLIVGGAVRDSLNGAVSKDVDIEVHGTNIENIVGQLRSSGYWVDEVGKQFGVLKVRKKGMEEVDVSVPRRENRVGSGHRNFEVELGDLTLEEAAERRDFTFNALMYDPKTNKLIDVVGGEKDFNNRIIRHVSEKFSEDPLRVLRAFQFAGRFDMSIHDETANLSKSLLKEYSVLSSERVQEEWGKFWNRSVKYSSGIKVLQDTGWDDIEPGLKNALSKIENIDDLLNYNVEDREVLGTAMIGSLMSKLDYSNFINKTVLGGKKQKQITNLIEAEGEGLSTPVQRRLYAERPGFSFSQLYDFAKLTNNKKLEKISLMAKSEGVWSSSLPLYIQGRDIIGLTSKKPGPWVGEIVKEFKLRQYNNEFNNKEEAIDTLNQTIRNSSIK